MSDLMFHVTKYEKKIYWCLNYRQIISHVHSEHVKCCELVQTEAKRWEALCSYRVND